MSLTCSAQRLATGEPLAGTAPFARLWVMLEQSGPWGRDALYDSHLERAVADALSAAVDGRPARLGVIRSVGAHADVSSTSRTLLVARTDPGATWLAERTIDDVDELVRGSFDVDEALTATGPPDSLPGTSRPGPSRALLVCTNAKRDQCCAVLGRPLAGALASREWPQPTTVWETSHTSGHRFAPTFVSLPDGYLYGGPDAELATVAACRGRSSLEPRAQVAELAVLREVGAKQPRPLDVSAEPDGSYRVRDGAADFTVTLTAVSAPDRPESCGKTPVPASWFTASVTSVASA